MLKIELIFALATGFAQAASAQAWPIGQGVDPAAVSERGTRFGASRPMQLEKGAVAGSSYSLWEDGVAEVAHWKVMCEIDQMTDQKSCLINSEALWLLVKQGKVTAVVVGDNHTPGKSEVTLRIDSAKAVSSKGAGWAGKQAEKLAAELAQGNAAKTRFTRWPDGHATDGQAVLGGLKGAIQLAQALTRLQK